MPRRRQKIDVAQKGRIALEAIREQSPIAELARRYQVHPNQIYLWRKMLENNVSRIFERSVRLDRSKQVEELHTKIGRLTLENENLAKLLYKSKMADK